MIWWLCVGLALGQEQPDLMGYRFGHFENIADPERSGANILRHLELARQQQVPTEAYLHRGEHQAAWFTTHAPEVIDALQDERVTLAYHPHGVRPFSDLVDGLADLEWQAAVDGFARLERCAIDYTTAQVDCNRPGGAAAVAQILDRPISSAAYSSVDAVTTYVYTHLLGIPVQGGSKSSPVTFTGAPVDLYWYMGALVINVPPEARVAGYGGRDGVNELRALAGPGPRLFSMLATDKVELSNVNRLIDQRYQPGTSRLEDVRPTPDEWYPAGKINRYWSQQEAALRAASALLRERRGQWLTSADLPQRVVPPEETLSADVLGAVARDFDPGMPDVEIHLPETHISHADLFVCLRTALLSWQASGGLPADVQTTPILGPIGDLRDAAPQGARAPIPPNALLSALAAAPADRVPWTLSVGEGQAPLNPVEQLAAMAQLYASIAAGEPLTEIPRLSAAPWPVPGGVRGRQRSSPSRWDGYTLLQHWTTKRARWKSTPEPR